MQRSQYILAQNAIAEMAGDLFEIKIFEDSLHHKAIHIKQRTQYVQHFDDPALVSAKQKIENLLTQLGLSKEDAQFQKFRSAGCTIQDYQVIIGIAQRYIQQKDAALHYDARGAAAAKPLADEVPLSDEELHLAEQYLNEQSRFFRETQLENARWFYRENRFYLIVVGGHISVPALSQDLTDSFSPQSLSNRNLQDCLLMYGTTK